MSVSEGRTVHNIKAQISLFTAYFEGLFAPTLTTNPLPLLHTELCSLITQMWLQEAALKLKNNCACGSDSVPNDLLKYACLRNESAQYIAHLLNAAVEGKTQMNDIRASTIIVL